MGLEECAQANDCARGLGVFAEGVANIARFAERACPFDADIGREAPAEFVTQPQTGFGVGEPRAHSEVGDFLGREIELSAGLKDEPLCEAKVVLGFRACGYIAFGRYEQCCANVEPVGCKALHAEHKISAIFAVEIALADAGLKIEIGCHRTAIEKLKFGILEFILKCAFAFGLPP